MNNRLFDFIEKSPTAFHTVANITRTLSENGFVQLREGNVCNLQKGKGYFVTRNGSSVIAFKIGETLDNYSYIRKLEIPYTPGGE